MSLSLHMQEAHYCSFDSQSNVYGLTKTCTSDGQHKLLVASLRGKVISMEFSRTAPLSKEVHFTYIPGDAEIVAIDAFNKIAKSRTDTTWSGNGIVVGITFVKASENKCQFLNIYSGWEPGGEFNLDSVAQGCQNIELGFVPYQLCHAVVPCGSSLEVVFLLSGSDQKIHVYREEFYSHTFNEQPDTEDLFPEFGNLTSSVTWISSRCYDEYRKRITAFGCQNGIVRVAIVDTQYRELLQNWSIQHDAPITSLQLFERYTSVPAPSFVNHVFEVEKQTKPSIPDLQLVVTNALEVAVVYRSVVTQGLGDPLVLPDSDHYDSLLCTQVADIDLDGENEILLGTYGQELLVYKYEPKTRNTISTTPDGENSQVTSTDNVTSTCNTAPASPDTSTSQTSNVGSDERSPSLESVIHKEASPDHSDTGGDYKLVWQRSFADPVLALDSVDITRDGLQELVVVSLKGLHILQHDLTEVAERCVRKLQEVVKSRTQNIDVNDQKNEEHEDADGAS